MMHTHNNLIGRSRRAMQQGQTIVVALLVLLLMAFVGGLFVSIVTHTLNTAARSNRVTTADAYAASGIRFADDQLTQSLDGADWRPPLQNTVAAAFQPQDANGQARYAAYVTANNLQPAPAQDPDKAYLDQGYARYTIGSGRFLLRLTYDPAGLSNPNNTGPPGSAYTDPQARYIKIEAVGREGVVDQNDPTTYQNAPPTRLAAYLVEYKAIGITDYARFETNPDKRSDIMALGVASREYVEVPADGIVTPGVFDFLGGTTNVGLNPIVTDYGSPDAYMQLTAASPLLPNPLAGTGAAPTGYTVVPGGGPIRVNGSARFYGENHLYLNRGTTNAFNETAEIAGDLLLDGFNPGTSASPSVPNTGQNAALILNPPAGSAPLVTDYVEPTNTLKAGGYDTHSSAVRDAGTTPDVNGDPRNINRLEPPTLDTVNPATSLTRYRALTENAAPRLVDPALSSSYAAGSAASGFGQAIYVDNSSDVQTESSKVVGGYTLVDEWLHRASAGAANHWLASFYRPPGVDIVLGRQRITDATGAAKTFYGVRLTRSDTDGAGQPLLWKDPGSGASSTTLTASYRSLNASNDLATVPAQASAAYPPYAANPNNDVIIYAEGNVRVRGVVSADANDPGPATDYGTAYSVGGGNDDTVPRHVTIVTNGTAYIEGNLLRGNPQSSITVLAHDYVCVNTTQFLAGALLDENPVGTQPPGAYTGGPDLSALDFTGSDDVLLQEFQFGLPGDTPAGTYKDASGNKLLALYYSAGPSAPGSTSADFDILDPRSGSSINGGGTPFTTPVLTNTLTSTGSNANALFRTTFDLTGLATLTAATQSQALQLAVRRSPGTEGTVNTQDLLLERAAILPMDIRIEAVLFAQTRSFFVIPGDWFNTSSDDNLQNFASSGGTARPGVDMSGSLASLAQQRYPFFGQPIDMKITINGSVSEARPADISSQTAWMQKWGWIPRFHGSLAGGTGEINGHTPVPTSIPSVGLSIIYNPLAGYPYYQAAGTPGYLRTDLTGRPLPYAPKLPVCQGLLYAGQSTDQPVLP